ncbi:MAG: diguanylate cyclase [Acidimicrobiia bacterium]
MQRSEELVAELDSPRFRRINGTVRSLVEQLVLASFGFGAAFLLTWLVADVWLEVSYEGTGLAVHAAMVAAFGGLMLFLTSGAPIHKAVIAQRALVREATQELAAEAARHRFRAELDEGLRMCDTEPALVELVGRAFDRLDPTGSVELLLADSSKAHLRVAVESSVGGPGCGVTTPWDCPAVRRGHTRQFPTSGALDACPHLRDRAEGELSATCIPLTVLGSPVGVVHRTDDDRKVLPELLLDEFETLADVVGSRLSVLRAMATNERQASTDPLTGVRNRRSAADELNGLAHAGERYAVAFADLDHFKDLNDTFGHEVGDRALRLFTRVVQGTIRDHDLVGRWGGEEFVVVFPGADRAVAAAACERIREALQAEQQDASVPPFSASFGVADSTQAPSADELLELADQAMFLAKAAGRDRVLVADGSPVPPVEPTAPQSAMQP